MYQECKAYYKSPIGILEITSTEDGISSIIFVEEHHPSDKQPPQCIVECIVQLEEYFMGKRKEFTVKLSPKGTEFQKRVWQRLRELPCGSTMTYAELAKSMGMEKAARAIGNANGQNPVSIIIPCHRLIGSDGSLRGYAGGLRRKKWLIDHESHMP